MSGFAAGVGIGVFVSRFDAACDKKQQAGVPAAAGVLPIPVCFHVLPGVMGELEGAGVDFGANIGVCNDGGGGDDGSRAEEFSEWCVGVKGAIRGVVKEGEGFVVLTVRRMENALYFFLCEDANSGYPREWASSAQFSQGLNQMELFNQAIDDALFVNQLQTVSQVTRQMTATEAQIRENEKLMTFSQTFTQFTADFKPLMERVFCLLFRLEKYPTVGMPKDLFEPVGADGKGLKIAAPEVRYLGRLCKALESARAQGLMESLTYALEMFSATQDPAWMDYFKPYHCMRFITDESNVDTDCLRTTTEAQELQEQREMIAQQQLQLQMLQQQADVAATSAKAVPNNMMRP